MRIETGYALCIPGVLYVLKTRELHIFLAIIP